MATIYRNKRTGAEWVGVALCMLMFAFLALALNGMTATLDKFPGTWASSPNPFVNGILVVLGVGLALFLRARIRDSIEITDEGDVIGFNWYGAQKRIYLKELRSCRLVVGTLTKFQGDFSDQEYRAQLVKGQYWLQGTKARLSIQGTFVDCRELFAYLADEGVSLPSAIEEYIHRTGPTPV